MSAVGEDILQLPQYAKLVGVLKEFKLPNESLIEILELTHVKIRQQAELITAASQEEDQRIKKHIESLHKNEIEYVKNIDTIVKVCQTHFDLVIISTKVDHLKS
jgi:hypothetical protein